ncbi:MAG: hypothetical protein ACTSPM_05880 [Candidatus Heimdallarchaeota archaeon]
MRVRIKKANLFVFFIVILFVLPLTVNEGFIEHTSDRRFERKNPLPSYVFPEFFVDNDIIYAAYFGDIVTMDCRNCDQIEITGILQEEKDSSRDILGKYNDVLFTLRQQEKVENDQTYYYTYFELINVSKLSKPILIGEVELIKSTNYNGQLLLHEINSHGYYFSNDAIYYFIGVSDIRCIKWAIGEIPLEIDDYYFDSGEVFSYWLKSRLFYIMDNKIFIPTKNESATLGFVIYSFTSYNTFTKESEWFGEMNITDIDKIYIIYCTPKYLYLKEGTRLNEIFSIEDISNPSRIGFLDLTDEGIYSFLAYDYLITITSDELKVYNWSNLDDLKVLNNFTYETEDGRGFFNWDEFNDNKITADRIYLPRTSSSEETTTLLILNWSTPTNIDILAITGLPEKKISRLLGTFPISSTLLIAFCLALVLKQRIRKKRLEKRN